MYGGGDCFLSTLWQFSPAKSALSKWPHPRSQFQCHQPVEKKIIWRLFPASVVVGGAHPLTKSNGASSFPGKGLGDGGVVAGGAAIHGVGAKPKIHPQYSLPFSFGFFNSFLSAARKSDSLLPAIFFISISAFVRSVNKTETFYTNSFCHYQEIK